MIDASTPAQVLGEGEGAADAVSLVDVLKEAKRLIVLINKMDEVSWSEEKYVDLVKAFETNLKELGVDLEKVKMIPVSALYGDNILDPSPKSPWYGNSAEGSLEREAGWTVVGVMDD